MNQKVVAILVIPEDVDAEAIMDSVKAQAQAAGATGTAWRSQDWQQAEAEGRPPVLLDSWEA